MELRLRIPASLDGVAYAGAALRGIGRQAGFNQQAAQEIELMSVEALNNIVRHALPGQPGENVDVHVDVGARKLCLLFCDRGSAMPAVDAQRLNGGDTAWPREELAEGGYGLHLLTTHADEVCYWRERDANMLRLVKFRA